MAQAGFHQINMIANDIRDEFTLTRTELANLIVTLNADSSQVTPITAPSTVSDAATSCIPTQRNNKTLATASETSTHLEMLKLLRSTQQELTKLNNPSTRTTNCPPRSAKKTPDNPTFTRKVTNMYCWTHGGCAHKSSKCNFKAPGDKNEATFDNKLGGSKGFCPWWCETKVDKRRVTFLNNAIQLLHNVLASSVSPSATNNVLPTNNIILEKGDSAASDHYFWLCDTSCLQNIWPATSNPITLPNQTTIHASHTDVNFHSIQHYPNTAKWQKFFPTSPVHH